MTKRSLNPFKITQLKNDLIKALEDSPSSITVLVDWKYKHPNRIKILKMFLRDYQNAEDRLQKFIKETEGED